MAHFILVLAYIMKNLGVHPVPWDFFQDQSLFLSKTHTQKATNLALRIILSGGMVPWWFLTDSANYDINLAWFVQVYLGAFHVQFSLHILKVCGSKILVFPTGHRQGSSRGLSHIPTEKTMNSSGNAVFSVQ